jgi:hypothetical protein
MVLAINKSKASYAFVEAQAYAAENLRRWVRK